MKINSEEIITLSNDRIILAGLLILVLGFFTWRSDLGVAKPLLVPPPTIGLNNALVLILLCAVRKYRKYRLDRSIL